ncbi:MAG: collagen type alpha, partial [Pseudonocardiales bacterium]|nr:collagen type alpha [Pseudonocardiales bacterium]
MGPMCVPAVTASGAGLLASAVALRWSRPDLTAALAEHVGEVRAGDDRTWVAAAGWLVHGRAAIGDGRQCASDALAEIARRGQGLLDDPAADRL